jgi:hypothetical protein
MMRYLPRSSLETGTVGFAAIASLRVQVLGISKGQVFTERSSTVASLQMTRILTAVPSLALQKTAGRITRDGAMCTDRMGVIAVGWLV